MDDFNQNAKEQCINQAIGLSRRSIKRDKSFVDVLITQIHTISKLSWIVHIVIIICFSMMLYYCFGLRRSWFINLFLVLLGPILQLAAIPEMMASYRYKVWQMEQCTVITLAQVILIRIAIWQTVNFLYIIGLTLILCNFVEITDLVIFIFIPYNMSNAIAFGILRHVKKNMANILCFFVDFAFVMLYYGGLQGRCNDILNRNLSVLWGISVAAFIVGMIALYKNISSERGMKYGVVN
ncbi:MAG: hypothetical protein K2M91_12435 [Lachnospiraceae bacterium]|nr:hypothetical protein [Lachnospiraceae bacterium]